MTLFDFNKLSEIKEQGWTESTLRPPLKFREVILDFKYSWRLYLQANKSFSKQLKFLFLRILQRVSYNIGWILSIKRYNKSLIKKGEV